MFVFGRFIRNTKSVITYPFWILSGKPVPDNHVYKKNRVRSIGALYSCDTFIETGSFYGQMINAMKSCFHKVLSVELFEPLFLLNQLDHKFVQNSRHQEELVESNQCDL